jgi:Mg2+ and Co2+ transporter CorA
VVSVAVVDNAVYVEGRRHAEPESLEVTYELLRDKQGMGWIGLYRPDKSEVLSVAAKFGIHPLAVEDTIKAHQRPSSNVTTACCSRSFAPRATSRRRSGWSSGS